MKKLIDDCLNFFSGCNFPLAICGGLAPDLFYGKTIRLHEDIDVSVFSEDRKQIVEFLMARGWDVYVRPVRKVSRLKLISNLDDEQLANANYVYAIKPDSTFYQVFPLNEEPGIFRCEVSGKQSGFDFIDIRFDHKDGQNFLCRTDKRIARAMDKAILYSKGIPYLSPEFVLFFKSKTFLENYYREKTRFDFEVVAPLLPSESRLWLLEAIVLATGNSPNGHPWIKELRRWHSVEHT